MPEMRLTSDPNYLYLKGNIVMHLEVLQRKSMNSRGKLLMALGHWAHWCLRRVKRAVSGWTVARSIAWTCLPLVNSLFCGLNCLKGGWERDPREPIKNRQVHKYTNLYLWFSLACNTWAVWQSGRGPRVIPFGEIPDASPEIGSISLLFWKALM